jgi:succinate-acetate transporter protein
MTAPKLANPAGLGLAGFALTTFCLSMSNAGLFPGSNAWIGYALAYGGAAQLLAGMWEFAAANTFGAVAFSSYGAFWIGTAIYVWFFAGTSKNVGHDLALLLLAWTIFTFYMTLLVFRTTNGILKFLFAILFVTFVLLYLGAQLGQPTLTVAGGYTGIVTALAAWYASYEVIGATMKT